jgi:glycolate oxidase FAD binding subunit
MDQDLTNELAGAIKAAHDSRRPLRIFGGDTKRAYGRVVEGESFSLAGHRGIVAYDPTELVITARAGTPIAEIEALLDRNRQMLAFEPPVLGPASTVGGVVAAGIAGPRRPFAGAVRDSLLGVKVIDGRGNVLRFGGEVFKNVAGFDAFRLMAGSLGCLAVLLELSLRVAPRPQCERAVVREVDLESARRSFVELMRHPLPLSGACYDGRLLHLRFSGGEAAVEQAAAAFGGVEESLDYWSGLRHFRDRFFVSAERLWRISAPMNAPELSLSGRWLWDWCGTQRWLVSSEPAQRIREAAHAVGGHATLFRGARADEEVFAPLPQPLFELHRRLKAAFDPERILNPGRMYAGL